MSIGSLAARTGVPVDTLRAWERRYGVLRPWRTEGGQRRYGPADVERVLWLAARCAEGQRISDAVAALTAMSAREAGADALPVDALIARIVASAQAGDGARMEMELDRAFAALPLVQVMELVVFPALADLGRRWAAGEPVVVAEHLLSGATERRLSARAPRPGVRGGVHHAGQRRARARRHRRAAQRTPVGACGAGCPAAVGSTGARVGARPAGRPRRRSRARGRRAVRRRLTPRNDEGRHAGALRDHTNARAATSWRPCGREPSSRRPCGPAPSSARARRPPRTCTSSRCRPRGPASCDAGWRPRGCPPRRSRGPRP